MNRRSHLVRGYCGDCCFCLPRQTKVGVRRHRFLSLRSRGWDVGAGKVLVRVRCRTFAGGSRGQSRFGRIGRGDPWLFAVPWIAVVRCCRWSLSRRDGMCGRRFGIGCHGWIGRCLRRWRNPSLRWLWPWRPARGFWERALMYISASFK